MMGDLEFTDPTAPKKGLPTEHDELMQKTKRMLRNILPKQAHRQTCCEGDCTETPPLYTCNMLATDGPHPSNIAFGKSTGTLVCARPCGIGS